MTASRLGVLFGVFMVASLLATRFLPPAPLALSTGIAPVTGLITTGARNLRRAMETVLDERDLRRENATLSTRAEAAEAANRRLETEVKRLRQVVRIQQETSPAVRVAATVTSFDLDPLLSRLTIDKGRQDGVQEGMPVTVPNALVGTVTQVDRDRALVRTLVDPQQVIGVTIYGKGGRAVARGVAGRYLRAEGFSETLKIKPGDVVMSLNAPGGAFPSERVGTVQEIRPRSANSLTPAVIVKPAVDVSTLEEVFLLATP